MSDAYTKLFSSITTSTIWMEPAGTRLVWITMLALKRRDQCVYASVPGLADAAKVTRKECDAALRTFLAPDPDSRTKDHDGRRIEEIDGGWIILNGDKFDTIRSTEERREYMREYMREKRANEKLLAESLANVAKVSPSSTSSSTNSKEQDQKTAPKGDMFDGIDAQVVKDFKALRSKLRAPITPTAMAGIKREAGKAGLILESALVLCCERGWRGFKAEWITESTNGGSNGNARKLSAVDRVLENVKRGQADDARRASIDGEAKRLAG